MLGEERVEAERARGKRQRVERRVALAEGDGAAEAVENGKQFAEAPDAGLVEFFVRKPTLAPEPLQRSGVGAVGAAGVFPAGIDDFKEIAAESAAEVGTGLITAQKLAATETAKLMEIVTHLKC